ncbi:two-component system, OmpR family, response regulator RegX3 [Bowdeniella nasicola]|uniref:Sensory transduction protein RegX3 n=1 Tax=Bowdeniella nasicola TaxID=208480 RepID=A0A1H3ZID9_9ACTO|nr:response regulator transcription factor [Bowdeniella nasicola]SEA23328.1 two-component system, OmpR family, response regulator RegX3 [Bowdeniella nasicola]
MTRILVVEDEGSYREPLAYSLTRDGYDVVAVEDGIAALDAFTDDFDVILLDLMLPGLSGTEVCREIRKTSNVPVIMLTAKDSEIDKVVGLEIGADDYVTKPYSYRELLARISAVLRRSEHSSEHVNHEEVLEVGRVRLSVDRHEVEVDGQLIDMPLREFELLEFLMRNSDRVLTRGQLLDRIWGEDYVGDTKTLDVHIKRIRGRIEEDPAAPRMIRTVRGLGYKMVDA